MQTLALTHGAGLVPELPLTRARVMSSAPTAPAAARHRPSNVGAHLRPSSVQWPSRLGANVASPRHSLSSSHRCRGTNPDGENTPTPSGPGGAKKGEENAAVTAASSFLGKAAQTPLWFLFLFLTLMATFGGYGYLIVANVEESNVPILVGPKGLRQQALAPAPAPAAGPLI